jgi:type I restriction enzyme, S subunit
MKQEWETHNFADVVFLQEGPGIRKYEYQDDGYPMINVRCVQDGFIDMTKSRSANYELATNKWKHFQIEEDDILFTISGTIGRSAIVKKGDLPLLMNTSVVRFRPLTSDLDLRFLYHIVRGKTFQDDLLSQSTGTAIKNVGPSHLKKILISYPPLPEQKRIVAKLDQAFSAIDQAKANVERNLQNAKDLFQSQLNQIFSQKGDGWVEKKLGDTCIVERGSSPRPIKDFLTEDADGVNWIKIGDTKNVSKYIYSTKQKITKEGAKRSRFVDVGDFILTNSMSYGKSYIMKTQGYIHDGWFVLRLPRDINSEFFWYLLSSPFTIQQFESLAAGAIVKNISGDLVKKAILPIPPTNAQMEIVKKLDGYSDATHDLETKYQQELDALDELKKSILQKAFNGEL